MATLKIEITAPNQAFLNYANDLGYSSTITTLVEGLPVVSPNPQTPAQYLIEKIKGIVSTAIASKTIQVIEETKRAEARVEAINTRTAIEGAMVVTIT